MSDKPIEPPPIDETAIAAQAVRWHAVLKSAGPKELAELCAWLKMSPRHGHHFLHATTLDRLLSRIDPQRTKFDPHAWMQEARENIVSLPTVAAPEDPPEISASPAPVHKHQPWRRYALAASLAAGLVIAGWLLAAGHWGWNELATHTGEQRIVELEDGSVVHLNTGTRVQIRLTAQSRDIRMLEGEALFKVQHEAGRPFRVHAPGGIIQAVGTQFNVYRLDSATRVSVLEGAVRISAEDSAAISTRDAAGAPAPLRAGQEAEIDPNGRIVRHPLADVGKIVAWQQRRLVFRADALADMVVEFNRYNQTPKFRLEGVDGHERHYTGTFDADDPESFATVLSQEKVYAVERTPHEIVIHPRR